MHIHKRQTTDPVHRSGNRPTGFTLVELLTVITIIGILAAILIPTVGKVRRAADRAGCAAHLRNLHTFISLYAADHKERLPTAKADSRVPELYWRRAILPYMNFPADGADHVYRTPGLVCRPVKRLVEVANPGKGDIASYGFNIHLQVNVLTTFPLSGIKTPSRTLMASEAWLKSGGLPMEHFQPSNIETYATTPGGDYHDGAQNILFADGHVEIFRNILRITRPPFSVGSGQDIWTP
ncbi:MAG: prepilin-type N-terminal cleavage/methylation domain-containing protein [Opitutaceae bacterium]|jgi:prepilin-type N-terminal cleavage/methylation domain-containing protein/prepilin-type processing-associated H-X9-DG protein|nr:prepilin-type N-terminal cleavage/methylation domain-containing protein [Opitutaceae bacterium]